MKAAKWIVPMLFVAAAIAIADAPKNPPEMKLPPGWTAEDMQACAAAATPGKMHETLMKGVGEWQGKSTMWMGPGAEPQTSDVTATCTPFMDGRFLKVEYKGSMGGMPYSGFGLYGFENVSEKFQCMWLDNCSTQMAPGTGELSADGKQMTWSYTGMCPITKKPVSMREIDTMTSPTAKTMELYSTDPKSGKEFKMMVVEFTKK